MVGMEYTPPEETNRRQRQREFEAAAAAAAAAEREQKVCLYLIFPLHSGPSPLSWPLDKP